MEWVRALPIVLDRIPEMLRYKPVVNGDISIMIDRYVTVELFAKTGRYEFNFRDRSVGRFQIFELFFYVRS